MTAPGVSASWWRRMQPMKPWPEKRYLRQGVRANGWVLLTASAAVV